MYISDGIQTLSNERAMKGNESFLLGDLLGPVVLEQGALQVLATRARNLFPVRVHCLGLISFIAYCSYLTSCHLRGGVLLLMLSGSFVWFDLVYVAVSKHILRKSILEGCHIERSGTYVSPGRTSVNRTTRPSAMTVTSRDHFKSKFKSQRELLGTSGFVNHDDCLRCDSTTP
ncbi:hypothetical protein BDR04DRAFT_29149 [Suillus decipiens]|nr:hypothetical protein BDR04DRAFT_29149 [Suillus decipiens]